MKPAVAVTAIESRVIMAGSIIQEMGNGIQLSDEMHGFDWDSWGDSDE